MASSKASGSFKQTAPRAVTDFADFVNATSKRYKGWSGPGRICSFVPRDELKGYWKRERIEELCASYAPYLVVSLEAVQNHYLQIFSILVYLGRTQQIHVFQTRGITDAQLPFKDVPEMLRTPVYEEIYEGFFKEQWLFCPLVIDDSRLSDLALAPQRILPFFDVKNIVEKAVKKGNRPPDAPEIFKVRIHKSCNNIVDRAAPPDGRVYILKRYSGERYLKHYRHEAGVLTTLQARKQKNIVGFYGSFTQNGTFNLILQYADGGNLLDFFQRTARPTDPDSIGQFWKSIFPIFQGLHRLHQTKLADESGEYRGIHQDLKPDNILLSMPPPESMSPPENMSAVARGMAAAIRRGRAFVGTGVAHSAYGFEPMLADFGHSHMRVVKEHHVDELGRDLRGNQAYGSPESSHHAEYLRGVANPITSEADIWSIGCVLSEAASWVADGKQGRKEYHDRRFQEIKALKNFEVHGPFGGFHDGVRRLNAVDEEHNRIRGLCKNRDEWTPKVLGLVEDGMLLERPADRKSARALWESFLHILAELEPETKEAPLSSESDEPEDSDAPESSASAYGESELPSSPKTPQHDRTSSLDATTWTPETSRTSGPTSPDSPLPVPPPRPGPQPLVLPVSSRPAHPLKGPVLLHPPDPALPPATSSPLLPTRGQPLSARSSATSLNRASSKPFLSLGDAYSWRISQKQWDKSGSDREEIARGLPQLPNIHQIVLHLRENLRERDRIFFVVDSRTMAEHGSEAVRAFEALAYIGKRGDAKLELAFASGASSTKVNVHADRDTGPLSKKLQACSYGMMDVFMEQSFGYFVKHVLVPKLPPAGGEAAPNHIRGNPLSVIVFTDGMWGHGDKTGANGVHIPVKTLIDELKSRGLPRTHVTVQFVRFGEDEDGARRLRYLVDFGREQDFNIIDTTPISGNVCSMLTGSIDYGHGTSDS